jgi:hypothetical protein
MESNSGLASTPRLARMLRELQGPPSGTEGRGVSRRMERSYRHRTLRRAGRRLLVGFVVIAGVALAVATDFLQFHAIAGRADADQAVVSAVAVGHDGTAH